MFRPLKYKKYAEKSCQKLNEFQNNFRKKYDTDNYENWFYNQSSETLRLYSENKEIYFKYIPVGTFSQKKNTWMWSWANESSVEPRKFQTLKMYQFHKAKNCWSENWWSSGNMSNFLGEFFYVLGVKKKCEIFFKNIVASALKSCIK